MWDGFELKALNGKVGVVKALLEKGANVNAPGRQVQYPVFHVIPHRLGVTA